MNEIPFVTIQLPIYNEKYVVERSNYRRTNGLSQDRLEFKFLCTDDSVLETERVNRPKLQSQD
jgi:hypothetical protein